MGNGRKYSYQFVKEYLAKYGYVLLSDTYENRHAKLEMLCPNGHKCKISLKHFMYDNIRCSICNGGRVATKKNIEYLKKYIFEPEGYELLEFKSSSSILLKCPNGHKWRTSYFKFNTKKARCPYCSGKLKTFEMKQDIARQRGYKLLFKLKDKNKYKFKCSNGHVFDMRWDSFVRGSNCPKCNMKYIIPYDEVKELVEKSGQFKLLTPRKEFRNGRIYIYCKKCGYKFRTNIYRILNNLTCIKCVRNTTISSIEKEIHEILKTFNIEHELHNRDLIKPKEIDILIPENNLGIEVNGLMWHSYQMKKKIMYHYEKWRMANRKGIKLLQFFSDEIYNYKDVVISKILLSTNKISNFTQCKASKCDVKLIRSKKIVNEFLNNYHLNGGVDKFTISVGLYYYDELVGVMVISKLKNKNKKFKNNNYRIIRLCYKPYTIIYGGTIKMFKYAVEKMNNRNIKWNSIDILTDLRLFTSDIHDNIYVNNGFIYTGILPPSLYYFNPSSLTEKYIYDVDITNKNSLKRCTSELTKNGYFWVFDCGYCRYEYKNT